jgi:hypothetical protein
MQEKHNENPTERDEDCQVGYEELRNQARVDWCYIAIALIDPTEVVLSANACLRQLPTELPASELTFYCGKFMWRRTA